MAKVYSLNIFYLHVCHFGTFAVKKYAYLSATAL